MESKKKGKEKSPWLQQSYISQAIRGIKEVVAWLHQRLQTTTHSYPAQPKSKTRKINKKAPTKFPLTEQRKAICQRTKGGPTLVIQPFKKRSPLPPSKKKISPQKTDGKKKKEKRKQTSQITSATRREPKISKVCLPSSSETPPF